MLHPAEFTFEESHWVIAWQILKEVYWITFATIKVSNYFKENQEVFFPITILYNLIGHYGKHSLSFCSIKFMKLMDAE